MGGRLDKTEWIGLSPSLPQIKARFLHPLGGVEEAIVGRGGSIREWKTTERARSQRQTFSLEGLGEGEEIFWGDGSRQ
jgi:hypothetical protein